MRVVALCPGPTATNFFTVLGAAEVPKMGSLHTPEAVVMAGLRALEQGRPYVVEGRRNAFGVQLTHMTPLALTARVFARVMRPSRRYSLEERGPRLHWRVGAGHRRTARKSHAAQRFPEDVL
jgi:short-subunit dehydrogenase